MLNSSITISSSLSSRRSNNKNNTNSLTISIENMSKATLEYLSYSGEFDWLILSADNGQRFIIGNGTGSDKFNYNQVCPDARTIDLTGATSVCVSNYGHEGFLNINGESSLQRFELRLQ